MAFLLSLVTSLTILSPNSVYADNGDENIAYHKVHNSAYGIAVNVIDGVEVSEKTISGILDGVRE